MAKSRLRDSIMSLGRTKSDINLSSKKPQPLQNHWRPWNNSIETKKLQYKALQPAGGNLWYAPPESASNMLLVPRQYFDDYLANIMKLIKKKESEKDGKSTKDLELVELTDNFITQCQTLYPRTDNLVEESRENVYCKEDEGFPSTPSFDSESNYSMDGASPGSSPRHDLVHQRVVRNGFKHKLERSNSESIFQRKRSNSISEGKEDFYSKFMAYDSRIQEYEKIIQEFRIEAQQTESSNQELVSECAQLKEKLMEREKELFSLRKAHQAGASGEPIEIKELERQVKELELEVGSLHSQKSELEEKMRNKTDEANQLRIEKEGIHSRIYQLERSVMESGDELCKKFEDSMRILSRRIQVAEQLHLENSDVYRKTKEKCEQEFRSLRGRVATAEVAEAAARRMKDMSLIAGDMLNGLETVALKLEACSGDFHNRISKASCEVLFAKDWISRRSESIKHVHEEAEWLLLQLDAKESETLELREKAWKLENKVRELEKAVEEKEEGMLAMAEEKREAIRQLCVWIDHHRTRCNHLKNLLNSLR
ncbi:COP1-interactive protein 1-like [Diospyros lotus]|uniref:COP1-interactive protein 1-like n=1 Tax=Diospyros lotus TaxID=55363 RepID=UPI0022553407|nr:COP1-interactive protein 1-like [Diospyros lotus]XP_052210324.1 COP1-interactive protein 1-like [Diospyros lotus]